MEHEHRALSGSVSPYPREYHTYPDSYILDIEHYARLLTPYASPALGKFTAEMERALNQRKGQDTVVFGTGPRHAWDIRYETSHRYPGPEDIRSDVIPLYMQSKFFSRSEFGINPQADAVRRMITTGSADYDTKSRLFDPQTAFRNGTKTMRSWFRKAEVINPTQIRFSDPIDPTLFEYGLDGYNKTHGYPSPEGTREAAIRLLPIPNNPDMDIIIISLGTRHAGQLMTTYQIHATGMSPHDMRLNNPDNYRWQERVKAHVRHQSSERQVIPIEGAVSTASDPLEFPDEVPVSEERLVSHLQSVFRAARSYVLRDTGLYPRGSQEYLYPGKPPLTFVRLELPDSLYERMDEVIGLLRKTDRTAIANIQTDIIAELATIALWNPIALGELLSHTELAGVLNGFHDMPGAAGSTVLDAATWDILARSRIPRYSSMDTPPSSSPEAYQKELAAGVYQYALLEPLMDRLPPVWEGFTDGIEYWVDAIDTVRNRYGLEIPRDAADPIIRFTEYFRFAPNLPVSG